MDEDTVRLLVMATVVSLGTHAAWKQYGRACLLIAGVAPSAYVALEAIRHPDQTVAIFAWLPVLLGVSIPLSAIIGCVVGLPFVFFRRRQAAGARQAS